MHPAVHQHIYASANDASSRKAQCITMRDSGARSDLARNQSYDEILSAFCILHDDHGDCDEDDHLVASDICMQEFNRNVSLIDEGLVKSPLQKT